MIHKDYVKEEFRPMVYAGGVSNKYTISNYGRIFNTQTQKFVCPVLTGGTQYFYVNINHDGEHKLVSVHNILARTFIGNPNNYDIVDHIDQNKYNNSLYNLRWVTKEQNARNSKANVYIEFRGKVYLQRDFGELLSREIGTPIQNALSYICMKLKDGMTPEQIYTSYYNNVKHGIKDIKYKPYIATVNNGFGDVEVDLKEYCKEKNMDFDKLVTLSRNGCSPKEVATGLRFATPNTVYCCTKDEHVSLCFVTKAAACDYMNITPTTLHKIDINKPYRQEISDILHNDLIRNKPYILDGERCSFEDILNKTGASPSRATDTVKANGPVLTSNMFVVKRVSNYIINGVKRSRKDWFELYVIYPKHLGNVMSKQQLSLEEALQKFGVDTSNLEIIPF